MQKKIAIGVAIVLAIVIGVLFLNKQQSVFGNGVEYDFDGDGVKDTAQIVVENSQGTGVFYYFVAELKGGQSQKFFIGDRIAPQSTSIDENGIVTVAYADRKPEESFTIAPSVGKSIRLFYSKKDNKFTMIETSDTVKFNIP